MSGVDWAGMFYAMGKCPLDGGRGWTPRQCAEDITIGQYLAVKDDGKAPAIGPPPRGSAAENAVLLEQINKVRAAKGQAPLKSLNLQWGETKTANGK